MSGEMADFQMDSEGHWGDFTFYDHGGTKTCRCCGAEGLGWIQEDTGKWRLYTTTDDGKIVRHECPINPLK